MTTSSVKINSQDWANFLGIPQGTTLSEDEFHMRSFKAVNQKEYERYINEGYGEQEAKQRANRQTAQARSQMNDYSKRLAIQLAEESDNE